MSKTWLDGAGVAAAVFAGGAQANLLSDGSFESLILTGSNLGNLLENYGPASAVGASWTNSSNFVLAIDTNYTEAGPINFVAQQGNNAVDLTGAGNQGPVELSQTVNLAAGSYLLSFYLGDISQIPNYTLASSVNVLINSVQQGLTRTNSAGTSTVNWAQMLVPFNTSGGFTTVTFSTVGLSLDSYTGIDSVMLTAVPEPGTWLMMVAGMAAVGFMAKRRSST